MSAYCIHNYLHDIYFVLGIISNLEMIQSIREDVLMGGNQPPMDTEK